MRKTPIIMLIDGVLIDPFNKDIPNNIKNNNTDSKIRGNTTMASWILSNNPNVPLILWYNKEDDSRKMIKLLREYYNEKDIKLGFNITEYSMQTDSVVSSNIMYW